MTSRNEYIEDAQAQARGDFAKHRIRFRDERSWSCFRPWGEAGWDSTFWFEVVVLRGGSLLVHGDIDLIHFAQYGKYTNPEEVVRWMGDRRDLGYYVAQKATIGMQAGDNVVTTHSNEVWLHDASQYIQEMYGEDSRGVPEWLCTLKDAVVAQGITQVVQLDEYQTYEAAEVGALDSWGRVPTWRLVYAHEAVRRLVQLLDEEGRAAAETRSSA